MSYDASAGTLRCPFCGSTELEKQPDAKEIAPSGDRAVRRHTRAGGRGDAAVVGSGFWRPGDLSQQAAVVKMTPVYVPYWVFQAQTHTFWTADTNRTPPGARASWYPVTGSHEGDIQIAACRGAAAHWSRRRQPLSARSIFRRPPAGQDRLDQLDLRAVHRAAKVCAGRWPARGSSSSRRQACQQDVPGSARNLKVNVRITDSDEPADARAGLDHGLSLSGSRIPLPGERPNGPRHRAGSDIVAEDRRRDSPRHACAIDPFGNCWPLLHTNPTR